jgi:hypothetical protein
VRLFVVYHRMRHVGLLCGRLHLAWLLAGALPWAWDRVGPTLLLTAGRLVLTWRLR